MNFCALRGSSSVKFYMWVHTCEVLHVGTCVGTYMGTTCGHMCGYVHGYYMWAPVWVHMGSIVGTCEYMWGALWVHVESHSTYPGLLLDPAKTLSS